MINKSAAIVIKDRSVLYLRRKGFLFWILPGGKIEENERKEKALNREIMEELSSKITLIKDMGSIKGKGFSKDLKKLVTVKLNLYRIELLDTIKFANEIIDMAYVKYSDIHRYLMTPIGIETVTYLHKKGLID